jgi:pyridine nucleotide-disulfide oxidoreductase family protein
MTRLVLVGAGHAHANVLLNITQRCNSDLEIILVSPVLLAPYSGMIPGWLAGYYEWDECCLNFESLCKKSGTKIYLDSVVAIDPDLCELTLSSGEKLSYDWLSLNIGSTLRPNVAMSEQIDQIETEILAMRPLSALKNGWEQLQASINTLSALDTNTEFKVVMVGGGAAGVESILAVQYCIQQITPQVKCQFSLVTRGDEILPAMPNSAVCSLRNVMEQRSITIVNHFEVDRITQGSLVGKDGRHIQANVVLWATGAQAYIWPAESTLATDEKGFIVIDEMLRSVSHPNVFATGDCARWAQALPKAGVFAVRMGPVLTDNLCAAIENKPLRKYSPQKRYLVLVGTGNNNAVAVWGAFSWQAKWVWRWKEKIDRGFLLRHSA